MTELTQIVAVGNGNGQVPLWWVTVTVAALVSAATAATVALVAAVLRHRFQLRLERWKTWVENYALILEHLWSFSARRISINFIDRMEEIGERIVEKNYKETLNRLIRAHLDHNRARLLMPDELVREYNVAYEQCLKSILHIKPSETVEDVLINGVDDTTKVDRKTIEAVHELSGKMRKILDAGEEGIYDIRDIPEHKPWWRLWSG